MEVVANTSPLPDDLVAPVGDVVTKKQLRIYEIIIEVVQRAYGWVTQEVVEQVRSLLHIE